KLRDSILFRTGAPRSWGTRPKTDPPPAPLFRLIETDRASERRRLAASGSDSAGRRGRGRATDRKGGAVALIRAPTPQSPSGSFPSFPRGWRSRPALRSRGFAVGLLVSRSFIADAMVTIG